MDIKQYSKVVCECIENLSDEEFNSLLIESGLEKCPIKASPDSIEVTYKLSSSESVTYKGKSDIYIWDQLNNNFNNQIKVA